MNARAGLLAASIAVLLAADGWTWLVERARPRAVTASVVRRVGDVVPGAGVAVNAPDRVQVTTVAGVNVDLTLASLQAACRADRWRCGSLVGAAVDDVSRALALADQPNVENLRPMVSGEGGPGYRLGYVTAPLIGALEIRYALVSGVASTFVTEALADRIAPSRADLARLALEGQKRDGEPAVVALAGADGLYRVVAKGDPAAELLDTAQMRIVATKVGASRLYCARPTRGELIVARGDQHGLRALTLYLAAMRRVATQRAGTTLMLYDVDAPEDAALSLAGG